MQIKEERKGPVKIIRLCGRLESNACPGLEKMLLGVLNQGEDRIVCDLSELAYVSSTGLRVLILLAQNMAKAKGRLALAALNDHIYEIFRITRFTDIFTIFPTCDEAVAQLESASYPESQASNLF